jgi:hypothetical protein
MKNRPGIIYNYQNKHNNQGVGFETPSKPHIHFCERDARQCDFTARHCNFGSRQWKFDARHWNFDFRQCNFTSRQCKSGYYPLLRSLLLTGTSTPGMDTELIPHCDNSSACCELVARQCEFQNHGFHKPELRA